MTGRELISASLRLIGAIATGEIPQAVEANDGLAAINRMIDSWSNEDLLIYYTVRDQLTLVSGTASYTIGSSGTFNVARPQAILQALLRVETSSPASEYPIAIRNVTEWASIIQKEVSSEIVTDLYLDTAYPLATINLYPKPSAAHKLVLFSLKPLTRITTLDTDISFPPGYEDALVYNGAIRLAPEYGRVVPEEIAVIAMESKASLKRKNHTSSLLRVDDALVSNGGFNILTGSYR
jgi:hypothetical protein